MLLRRLAAGTPRAAAARPLGSWTSRPHKDGYYKMNGAMMMFVVTRYVYPYSLVQVVLDEGIANEKSRMFANFCILWIVNILWNCHIAYPHYDRGNNCS